MKFINEYKKYFIKGLVVFFLVVTINFAYGFSEIDNSYTEENKQYDELILNDEELLDVYTEEENLLLEEIEYQDEIKKVLTTYLVEDESGAKYFEISEDEYDKLNSDMQNIIDESVKIYSEYLLGNYILSQNGEFEHKDNSEIIELQSADFTVITKKVWGIPYGFELRFAPGPWSYIASTIAIVGGSVNLLWDILSFDPNVITRLAYTFTGALQTILLDLVTYITKLPSFIVKSSVTLLRLVKNNPFISGSLNVIMTVLKFVFPPMVHGLAAFKAVQQNKSVSYHYNTIFYSKTTVNGKVI